MYPKLNSDNLLVNQDLRKIDFWPKLISLHNQQGLVMASTALSHRENENHFQKLRSREVQSFHVQKKTEGLITDTVQSLNGDQIVTLFSAVKSFNAKVAVVVKKQNPSIFETSSKRVDASVVAPTKVPLSALDGKVNAALSTAIQKKNPSLLELHQKPVVTKAKYDLNTEIQKAALIRDIKRIRASVDDQGRIVPGSKPLPSTGDIFLRFMALLKRMYNQTQVDSNQLYKKVKERTDQIELLTTLVTEVQQVKGDVDWSNDDKMKAMLDYAIDHCGLNWEKGKYAFPEAEKSIFRDCCLARKDCMDRWSKLDQPEMQKFLQWLVEFMSMLSNTGKLRHDTAMGVIANFKS